ncbi:hypothetical protein A1019T_02324 [Psychrobacter pasteurii]|uniref:tRNA 2-thiouridine synthesizing protein B n=1 Tax=Psychrobacter pasteurii TaxID=1945520 RepID=A0A1R4EIQ1_9GAMM|nr:hypothetical protein [Psychrobacter pasteurii]SJM38334.1 hypothetical protein A1019T_02324 [Psychrobacter pasteurii]
MSTLFQLHAPMNTLKAMVKEMAPLWHSGDSILLLAETVAALPWLKMYIDDVNYDDEAQYEITDITAVYVLADDLAQLNEQAKTNLDLSKVNVIDDNEWVQLTQSIDRVITLNSIS